VTARSSEQDKRRSRDAGFQQHLVKPVKPESLLNELVSAMGIEPLAPSV